MSDITNWFPEFKVSAESDQDLMRYFVRTSLLDKVLNQGRWMIIGRKGTGKTAVYEYLRQADSASINGFTAIPLSFRDYPWPIQRLYREAMEAEISSYQRSWRYLIFTRCLASLIASVEEKKKLPADLSKAKKILSGLYGSPNPSVVEIIKSKLFRLKSFTLPSLDVDQASLSLGGVEFEDVVQDEELKRKLRANAFQLLDYFENTYKAHAAGAKQLVVIDQLDENWLQGEVDEYSRILVNLLLCAQSINHDAGLRDKVKVVIFLRADIYETLRFNDKNKVYQDGAVEIKWDYDALDSMVSERIQKYAPDDLGLDVVSEKTGSIFQNKTVRHGATPLRHMLRRSFYRPRDVIVYLNKIRDFHSVNINGLYTSKDLYAAERAVSSSMYDELIDEWSAQKPDFELYLMALQNIGYEIFTKQQYFDKYSALKSGVSEAEVNEILRFLFVNSIIGQKASVNWEYVCTNQNMQIDFQIPFHVNNGLKYRLVLTENREKRKRKAGGKSN
ncbi:P-loop ATPase, Sll1717 family [Burkholderia pseudomallei]|uniref:P-loop ATPase, Sll1717 family n=1 Tax=Burkholderia pseudomallei TaxID=28450 RepID=UPI000B2CF5B4|nr:hypothetical protein [Burkholderia pseudomallei]